MPVVDLSSVGLGNITYSVTQLFPNLTISAQDSYNTWAAELGVPNTGSDEAVNQNNFLRTFNYGTKLWNEQASDDINISSEGSVQFYKAGLPAGATIVFQTIPNITPMVGYDNLPDVMISWHPRGQDSELNLSSRIRTANGITIMLLFAEKQSNSVGDAVSTVAVRLELGRLEIVGYTSTAGFPQQILDYDITVFDAVDSLVSQTSMLVQNANENHQLILTVPIPITSPPPLQLLFTGNQLLSPPKPQTLLIIGGVPSFGFTGVTPVLNKITYVAVLTGIQDGLSDVILKIKNLSIRAEKNLVDTTQIVIPNGSLYVTSIAERPNGLLFIKKTEELSDGSKLTVETEKQNVLFVTNSNGTRSFSITINSKAQNILSQNTNPKEYTVTKYSFISSDEVGNLRIRLFPIADFKIGDAIILLDGRRIIASSVVTTINENLAVMEISNG